MVIFPGDEPPIHSVIEAGLVPVFNKLLKDNWCNGDLDNEITWILTNLASGTTEETEELLKHVLNIFILNSKIYETYSFQSRVFTKHLFRF